MKMLTLSAALLLGTASLGLAQTPPTQPAEMPPAPAEKTQAAKPDMPPPPPGRPGPDMHRPDGPPPGMHRPPPPKAAHFRIKQGDTRLDIKCAEDEPMKACADLVMQILDRANNGSHANADDSIDSRSNDRGNDRGAPSRDYGRQRW